VELTEDELIAAVIRVLSGAGPEVRVGPGDDAAVMSVGEGAELVLTTDALVEGVHFDRAHTSARDLGAKAVTASVSDIAAMAASPRAAVCALVLPPDVEASWVMELMGGMRAACDEYALWLVGGDLSRGPALTIAVTVTGEVAPGRAVTRAGAKLGDAVVVTGALGGAAAGLRAAREGDASATTLLRAQFRPVARVGEAAILARHGATAMIDVSDGLALDLSRLCAASGVGVRLDIGNLPVAQGATLDDALSGGEDYELVAAIPEGSVEKASIELGETFGVALTAVGRIAGSDALIAIERDGSEAALEPRGWDHFGR